MKRYSLLVALLSAGCVDEVDLDSVESESRKKNELRNNFPMPNELGVATTWSANGVVDLDNEFFQEFGTNDRTCGSCHKASEGWTVSASRVRAVFEHTSGLDPIFRTNDGSNSPNADVSTEEARRAAYSMLLSRGTIRVGIGVPAGAEFELVAWDDPYGYASPAELSLFRRPLPAANLTMIPVVMWDGRVAAPTVNEALALQANGATQGHAAAPDPITEETRQAIVNFETALFNAQVVSGAGRSDHGGANGGAEALAGQAFVAGRFNLFDAWADSDEEARRAVFRGQELFNTRGRTNLPNGTCRACHSAENVGTNKLGIFFNVGVSSRRAPDQPLYTFKRISTGETIQTTDPGRALITGKWSDMNRFKVPSIRALGSRAPYFHDGSANTLADVVKFYESSLGFNFTDAEEADLVAFMSAL